MGKSGSSNTQTWSVNGQDVGSRVQVFLRDRYPEMTAKLVSRDTGISPATVAKWLSGSSMPSLTHLAVLSVQYRVEFIAAVFVEVNEIDELVAQRRIRALEAASERNTREIEMLRGRSC